MGGFGGHDHGGHGAGLAREARLAKKQRRRLVKQKGFDQLEVSDVWSLANGESADVPSGYPAYYLRPWTQLREEMNARKVQKVGQLPPDRVKVFRRTTRLVPRLADFMFYVRRVPWVRFSIPIVVRPALKRLAGAPERTKQP